MLIRGAKEFVLVLRGADFALLWFFCILWLFRFFKYVKTGHFSPRYHWFSHRFGIYIDIMHLLFPPERGGAMFRASSTSVSQVHLHSTWEDEGVETRFVDEYRLGPIDGERFVHRFVLCLHMVANGFCGLLYPSASYTSFLQKRGSPCSSLFSSPIRRHS